MKRSKRTWLLKAGIVFLAAVIGVFMLIPAGSLFAQAGSLEGRWIDDIGRMVDISGTTAVVVGGQYDGQEAWTNITQVGDNQWTALEQVFIYDENTGEVLELLWIPITITMSPDGNSLFVIGVYDDWEYDYDLYRVTETPAAEPAAQPRSNPLTVWQVNCLEGSQVEFIFVYPYKDNNWLTIYDSQGNEVYRKDVPYSSPKAVVTLPNGMYTVKTFKSEGRIIQEFEIGLPCGAAPVTVADVAELPYTGFNYLPYSIAAAVLAGLAGMFIALRKKNLKFSKK